MNTRHRTNGLEVCWYGFLSALLFLALSVPLGAQTSSGVSHPNGTNGQAKISVTSELVLLPVSVTDASGAFVTGLGKQNFLVYEDGNPQTVAFFSEEDTPVTVGLIVDHSRSMGPKLPEVVIAVSAFAHSSNPEDEMFVVDFSDSVSIRPFGGKAFTSDVGELEKAVNAVSARGQTALYDALAAGIKHLQLGSREKKALIIVSDGGDNASVSKYSDVLNLARQSHAVIYSIGLIRGPGEEENPRVLERLCKDTGGISFLPGAKESISSIAKKIAQDLREQYTLGYVPGKRKGNGSFHRLAVKVIVPGRGKMRVRTRTGYAIPPETAKTAQQTGSVL
jgi:Ca-activated chloride channel homolog